MTPDEYRRRAIYSEQRSAAAADPDVKVSFSELARDWRALADQAEWLEMRYGPIISAEFFQIRSKQPPAVQQQQQEQPKED
jgi:hypothetical protein